MLEHQFEEKTFAKPTQCDLCNKMLWGFVKQGVYCKVCGYVCHTKCSENSVYCGAPETSNSSKNSRKNNNSNESSSIVGSREIDSDRSNGETAEYGGGVGVVKNTRSSSGSLQIRSRSQPRSANSNHSSGPLPNSRTVSFRNLDSIPPPKPEPKAPLPPRPILHLIVSSAINMTNESKLPSDSSHPPLNLQTTTINFKKFVQKCGFIFALQDAVEDLVTWKNSANTLLAMVVYIYLCLYPHLIILTPLVIVLSVLISSYTKRFPDGPINQIRNRKKSNKNKKSKQSVPMLPAENSVDYLKNMQNIQNVMGTVSDGYDAVIPLFKHLDWSNEQESLRITQIVVLMLALLTATVWFVPWRKVFIVVGLSVFILNNKFVKALIKESSPLIMERGKIFMDQWKEFFMSEDDEEESEQDEIIVSVYENQRWWAGTGFGPQLLRSERAPWSSSMAGTTGLPPKDEIVPHEGYEWAGEDWSVDMNNVWEDEKGTELSVEPDEGGWVYTDNQWENPVLKSISGNKLFTRRRKWIRKARKIGTDIGRNGVGDANNPTDISSSSGNGNQNNPSIYRRKTNA
ncbi:3091_t:CDS:2 [Ambispora gerdemannii]|uniref:3091_t:CDS:1 n=1 Tax=Ambispora gerdemannii TaxID=144530 RepID=A0A9N9AK00_9GLOM|nr:3091_t:CDS:2 [Ambispora gerdemannii]